jgi:hypothetical protein
MMVRGRNPRQKKSSGHAAQQNAEADDRRVGVETKRSDITAPLAA